MQCFLTSEPFGKARAHIPNENGEIPKHQQIFFSIYQALETLAKDGKPLYEQYDTNFFDLVIIDECHRSAFGYWHRILRHFTNAVHLGMTATPKRSDNIDTYKYFGEPTYIYIMVKVCKTAI